MSLIRTGTGRHIFYDDLGTGIPILLIPGAIVDRRGWMSPLVKSLAGRRRVIVMDIRDGGESAPESDDYTMEDLAGDAIALLDALLIDRVHVVGYSLGGVVARQVAVSYSERVLSLVTISSFSYSTRGHRPGDPMPPPEDWFSEDPFERARLTIPFILGPAAQERLDDAALRVLAEADSDNHITWKGVMRQQGAQFGVDLRAQLRNIRLPALVIHGEVDPAITVDRGIVTAESIPSAELLLLPGVGHLPWIDEPDTFPRAILDFVAKVEQSAPGENPRGDDLST